MLSMLIMRKKFETVLFRHSPSDFPPLTIFCNGFCKHGSPNPSSRMADPSCQKSSTVGAIVAGNL